MQEIRTIERSELDNLYSVDDLAARYPKVLTVRTLRWQLRHREENGLCDACVKVGKKLLINEPKYAAWLTTRSAA